MKNVDYKELEALISEEIDNLDEGWWDKIKGMASGVSSALTSPLGKVGQGYSSGKASSAFKSAAIDIERVRNDFVDNVESLFTPSGADQIIVPPELKDMQEGWNSAVSDLESASEKLQQLSLSIQKMNPMTRDKPNWGDSD